MAITQLTDPFAGTQFGGTAAQPTVATIASGLAVGNLSFIAYVQGVTTPRDTFTVVDSKTNTWVKDDHYLANNNMIVAAWSKLTTALVSSGTPDTETVTSSVSRSRRAINGRAWSGVEAASSVVAKNEATNTSTPSVSIDVPVDGCLVIGVVGHALSTGAIAWAGSMTDPETITTAAADTNKKLSIAHKTVATAGSTTISGTLDVAGPWTIMAIALRPTTTSFTAGLWHQMDDASVWQ